MCKKAILLLLICNLAVFLFAKEDSVCTKFALDDNIISSEIIGSETDNIPSIADTVKPLLKKWQVNAFAGTFYVGSLTGLGFLWYSDYSTGKFHFFNDMDEWKGIDKLGHFTSAFHLARVQSDLYQNAGYSRKSSAQISLACSFAYMSIIEVLDGFSDGWGFSVGDLCANTLGMSLFAVNELTEKDNLVSVKMGFHQTKYAKYNPSILGENLLQQPLKDYNGQTYWLSLNIKECLKKESKFPPWLNIALGYGAEGMTGGDKNPDIVDGKPIPHFNRYSQLYIAPDIDFSKIPVKGRGWKLLLRSLNFLKCPAPALEWNSENGFRGHFIYF